MWIIDWLFKKRRKTTTAHTGSYTGFAAPAEDQETYLIEFDQMVKGVVTRRGRKKVRQCAVMVGSDLRLVTSGDRVARDTYLAMCKYGYIDGPEAELNTMEDISAAEAEVIEAPLPPAAPEADDAQEYAEQESRNSSQDRPE